MVLSGGQESGGDRSLELLRGGEQLGMTSKSKEHLWQQPEEALSCELVQVMPWGGDRGAGVRGRACRTGASLEEGHVGELGPLPQASESHPARQQRFCL